MSEKALLLTRRCALNMYSELDLGCCGLEDFDFIYDGWLWKAFSLCTSLQTLILSDSWYEYKDSAGKMTLNGQSSSLIRSKNSGRENFLRIIPDVVGSLKNLVTFICAGNGYKGFDITDISIITQLKHLECLDLSNNKIEDLTGIENLKELKKLDLRANKISSILPLIPLLTRAKDPMRIVNKTNVPINFGEINLSGNPIESTLWKTIDDGIESILEFYGISHIKHKKMNNNTVKIFFASSSDLKVSRLNFEVFIYRVTKELHQKGIYLILEKWEDFLDSISFTRNQDNYNQKIAESDIFIVLYSTKVGKYTYEEFETAYKKFLSTGSPHIFTYFMDMNIKISSLSPDDFNSLSNFQDKLRELGHFPTAIENDAELHLHFRKQLNKLYGI